MKHPSDDELAAFVERRSKERARIEEHIDECAECRVAVAHLAALAFGSRSGDRTAPPIALAIGREPVVPPGEKIARYVVRREIGRGAMGVVVAAYDPELDREVALKIVRPTGDREHVLREARTMARFAHPNVVTIHDVGDLGDGRVFLAMELVRGSTLRAYLRERSPDRAVTIDLFVQAGRGLAAAHAAGIIHRDFKPDNVLVGDDGRVRVTDFGLARAADDAAPADVAGTPVYMAPEQHEGKTATPATDQFAFAVALYEALAGKRPFSGSTYDELSKAKKAGAILPWSETKHDVPDTLREATEKALSVDPGARHASIEVLVAVLAAPTTPKRWPVFVAFAAIVIGSLTLFVTTKRDEPKVAAAPAVCTPMKLSFSRPALEKELEGKNPESVARSLSVLSEQAHAITAASEAACKAEPAARAATEACLVRRAAELEGVSGALPELKSLDDVFALEPLGSVAACTPSTVAALPEEADKRKLVLDVYRDIAAARVTRFRTSEVLDAIAKRADASGHAPAGGELALARAEIESKTSSYEEAIAIAQASRDDDLAARAWRARVRSDAKRGDSDLAAHATLAIGAIERVGRPEWKADVLDWRARDDFDEARFRAAHEALDQAKRLRAIVPARGETKRPPFEDDLLRVVCLLEEERYDDAKAALYRVQQSVGENAEPHVRARVLALEGRLAFVNGNIDEALALFARAQEAALEQQKLYVADKGDAGVASAAANARRHAARHGFIEASFWAGRAQLAQNRLDLAEKSFETVVVEARSAGVNIEPLPEVRAIAELARIQRATGKRNADPKKTPLGRATRSVTFLEGRNSPLVGEALLAQAEAFVAAGKLSQAVPLLLRAEKLTAEGAPETHADCIILLHRAAKGAQDDAAVAASESAARLASVSALFGPETPTRRKLSAEFQK